MRAGDKVNSRDRGFRLKAQCASCPWKVATDPLADIPGYDRDAHLELCQLRRDTRSVADPGRIMGCHQYPDDDMAACVGWIVYETEEGGNIGLRWMLRGKGPFTIDGPQHARIEDTIPAYQKIVCVDFDGVLHRYTSGWQGIDVIPDSPVPGAFEWLVRMLDHPDYRPVVYSSRSKAPEGIAAMKTWMSLHGFNRVSELWFPAQKPPAYLTIDDRAICFTGLFPSFSQLDAFKPWNKS